MPVCPFCAESHDDTRCNQQGKNYEIPPRYLDGIRQEPPLWLMATGYKAVGKSFYLTALTMTLERLSDLLPSFSYEPLGAATFDRIREIRRSVLAEGTRFESTNPNDIPPPLLIRLDGLSAHSRCVVLFDSPGEVFEGKVEQHTLSPAIKQVNTVWFMVDIRDLLPGGWRRLSDLFLTYQHCLDKYRSSIRGWHLIVVYTKADVSNEHLPADVRAYIKEDPIADLLLPQARQKPPAAPLNLSDYLRRMEEISESLRVFTRSHLEGGGHFENLVKGAGMSLSFSIVSSTGQETGNKGVFPVPPNSRRVIDPLLWAIHRESRTEAGKVTLIVDDSSGSALVQQEPLMTTIWKELNERYRVSVYFLGRDQPCTEPGQSRPYTGRSNRPRVLGPILERLDPGESVVLLTAAAPIDLRDFINSRWRQRLLVLAPNPNSSLDWPHQMLFQPGDAAAQVSDRLLQLPQQ